MKRLPIIIAALILGSPAALVSCTPLTRAGQERMAQAQGNSVEHFMLENGLNVYLTRNSLEPRFQAQVVVNAGSKQDPAEATGIAHYLEHMLFKGTEAMGTQDFAKEKPLQEEIMRLYEERFAEKDEKKRQEYQQQINKLAVQASEFAIPGEMDALYSRLGAEGLNAYTSDEETVYIVNLPKNRLEQWAMIESHRFAKPVFRLFQSELETVYEEKNRSLDNKEAVLYEAVERQLYKKHPYGTQTTLGSVDHLKNPSLKKMYEFYARYYVPNNMALVVSGDIDLPEAKRIITQHFGSWQKQPVAGFTPPAESDIQSVERVAVNYKGEEKALLAFRSAPYHSPDRPALMMVDMLLDSGAVGLIKLNLVEPQQLRGAGSYPRFNNDFGAQYLWGIPKEGQSLLDVEKLLLAQLEKVKQGEFTPEQLKGIILDFEISQKRTLETNEGRADLLTEAFLRQISVAELLAMPDKLKKLTRKEIIRVANKYFGTSYVAGYRHDQEAELPKITKPQLEKVSLNPNARSGFAQAVEAVKTEPIPPRWVNYDQDFQVRAYAPGVLFYHVPNPLNDIFNLTIAYEYGDKHHPNLCYVMDELDFAGNGGYSAEEVQNQLYQMGVAMDFSCDDYGFALSLSGLDSQLENGLALAESILWSAKLDEERFQAKIANMITSRADEKKDVNILRSALSAYIRYGERSGFLDRPSQAELKKLTTASYPAMREQLRKQNFKVYYTGQLPAESVEKIVKKHHQPQNINFLLNARKEPEMLLKKRHDKPVKVYFLQFPGAQSHIALLVHGETANPQETLPIHLFNQYMDGDMSAVMFQEVRESRALAYATSAIYRQAARLGDQDQMMGYIGTQADKTVEALALFIELLRHVPASQGHLDRARQSLENAYRTSYLNFRDVVGTVEYWADQGLDKDPRPERLQRLPEIDLKALLAFAQDKISSRSLTFLIVGDKGKIEMKGLQKLGEVEEIKLEQLFQD